MGATKSAVPSAGPTTLMDARPATRATDWRPRLRLVVSIILAVLVIAAAVVGGVMFDSVGSIWVFQGTWLVREVVPGTIVFAIVAVLVLRHPSAAAVGWVMVGVAGAQALGVLAAGLFLRSTMVGSTLSTQYFVASHSLLSLGWFLGITLLPLVFPSGWLSGWGWRALVLVVVGLFAVAEVFFTWGNWESFVPEDASPLDWDAMRRLNLVSSFAGLAVVVATLAERVRRGPRLVRQQVAPFAVVWLVTVAADQVHAAEFADSDSGLAYVAVWIWPVVVALVIGLTVVQVGLWNTRLVIRRFVLYLAMTALLTVVFAGVYFAVLLVLSSGAVDDHYRWLALAVAAAAVIAAEPLRRRLRTGLENRLLGERSEPLRPLGRLDALTSVADADDERIQRTIVETVRDAVRAPGVALALHQAPDIRVVATIGIDDDPLVLPLLHRGERLGELRVAARTPGESYGRTDRALLDRLAAQVAAVVYGLRRDTDIAELRNEAIEALVEQRVALGRDLHDGLAPLLAGAGLTAEALRRGMPAESPDAEDAARLSARLRAAASEVRRISHDLQPNPDGPHLAAVIADYVDSVSGPHAPAFTVRLDDHAADGLSATAELTLSRVALEAITNVVRHAEATRADVSLERVGDALVLRVRDDGRGIAQPYVSGLGITSMRSRVQALGGTFDLGPGDGGGTLIMVRVPAPR